MSSTSIFVRWQRKIFLSQLWWSDRNLSTAFKAAVVRPAANAIQFCRDWDNAHPLWEGAMSLLVIMKRVSFQVIGAWLHSVHGQERFYSRTLWTDCLFHDRQSLLPRFSEESHNFLVIKTSQQDTPQTKLQCCALQDFTVGWQVG